MKETSIFSTVRHGVVTVTSLVAVSSLPLPEEIWEGTSTRASCLRPGTTHTRPRHIGRTPDFVFQTSISSVTGLDPALGVTTTSLLTRLDSGLDGVLSFRSPPEGPWSHLKTFFFREGILPFLYRRFGWSR